MTTQDIQISVEQLSGTLLNYFVALAANHDVKIWRGEVQVLETWPSGNAEYVAYRPCFEWKRAGLFRDRYNMAITPVMGGKVDAGMSIPTGGDDYDELEIRGRTACEAICRLVVLRCLGPTVTLPASLSHLAGGE